MNTHSKKPAKKVGGAKFYLHTRKTTVDGEYDMEGVTNTLPEFVTKLSKKARRMLNPKGLPNVQFNEYWTYYKGRSRSKITKQQFQTNGGSFEYIAWSNYAGGNRFEVSGGVFKEVRIWYFSGYGRFS